MKSYWSAMKATAYWLFFALVAGVILHALWRVFMLGWRLLA